MTDIRQYPKYADYLNSKGWIVEKKDGVYYYLRKILFFSVMKVQRPKKIDLNAIKKLSKKHRAFQVTIEPNTFEEADMLIDNGWKIVFPFVPSLTTFINLKDSQKKIIAQMSKNARYSIRKSEHIDLIEESNLKKFRKHWRESVSYKRYVLSIESMEKLKKSFGEDSLFLLAENGISGGIFLKAGDVAYYWYGFVNKDGRKKLSQYKVMWEGIKWAKGKGAKTFDTEGIFDERFPIPAWRGFTKFKKGFGGKEKKFPGAYQKIFLPFNA